MEFDGFFYRQYPERGGGSVSLMDGRLGETLTAGSFAGDGATLYLDADGSTNTGNDHVYVMGSHTGNDGPAP